VTVEDFWPLGISSHDKEEIWFVKVSANGHSILEQLGHKPRTFHMRRGKISQMVTYLICDLRKEFFKRVQARFR